VAILGEADFDVRTIDLSSIRLEGLPPLRSRFVDIASSSEFLDAPRRGCAKPRRDGFEDLLVQFSSQALVAALGVEIEDRDVLPVTLTGSLLEEAGGGPFIGEDTILIRKPPRARQR
jgi:hypothetical protein